VSAAAHRGSWATNRLANPIVRRLLRGPFGRRLGRRLAVLRYRGRRSGEPHELVVQYVQDAQHVWIMVGRPHRKTWWLNLREPAPVELRIAGHDVRGVALAINGRDRPDEVAAASAVYVKSFPRARPATGGPDADPIDLTQIVMVRVDLDTSR
jgi:hypothetical protein